MSSTTTSIPRGKRAGRCATTLILVTTLDPFFYGFESMVLSAAIKTVRSTLEFSPILQGVAGAAGVIGGLTGVLATGRTSDKTGRETALMWVGPSLLVEALLGPISPLLGSLDYPFLPLTRIVGSISFDATTTVVLSYAAEAAPANTRERLAGFRQPTIILGLFFVGLTSTAVISITGGAAEPTFDGLMTRQVLFACPTIPALLFMVFTARIPESLRYLVSVGRTKEAEEILAKLSGKGDPMARVEAIAQSLTITGGARFSAEQILSSQRRGLMFVGMAITAFQQLTGINGVFFYSDSLFAIVDFTESMALARALLITTFKIVDALPGIMLVSHVGHKRMLIHGDVLIFVSLSIVVMVFTVAPAIDGRPNIVDSPVLAFLAIAALCMFLLGFISSWDPIFSIVVGEMFPNSIRGGAILLASGADFPTNFLVIPLFPFLTVWSSTGTYWIYCAFGVLAVIFTVKFLTKTSGAKPEDMDKVVTQK